MFKVHPQQNKHLFAMHACALVIVCCLMTIGATTNDTRTLLPEIPSTIEEFNNSYSKYCNALLNQTFARSRSRDELGIKMLLDQTNYFDSSPLISFEFPDFFLFYHSKQYLSDKMFFYRKTASSICFLSLH
eukprot:598594_1